MKMNPKPTDRYAEAMRAWVAEEVEALTETVEREKMRQAANEAEKVLARLMKGGRDGHQ